MKKKKVLGKTRLKAADFIVTKMIKHAFVGQNNISKMSKSLSYQQKESKKGRMIK